jgi:hypothetical protein
MQKMRNNYSLYHFPQRVLKENFFLLIFLYGRDRLTSLACHYWSLFLIILTSYIHVGLEMTDEIETTDKWLIYKHLMNGDVL